MILSKDVGDSEFHIKKLTKEIIHFMETFICINNTYQVCYERNGIMKMK